MGATAHVINRDRIVAIEPIIRPHIRPHVPGRPTEQNNPDTAGIHRGRWAGDGEVRMKVRGRQRRRRLIA